MTELALRSTNQHRPRRWLLSGGSQPRRSQLTERADSVAQAGVIIRRVLKLPQAIGRQSSQRWLRRRPPVYSKNSWTKPLNAVGETSLRALVIVSSA